MNKILVVNVNWLGDVILSTPIFRALKERFPQARLSCLAVPRVEDILTSCPYVDEVIIYDERGRDRGLPGKWRLIRRLRRGHFDAVFLLHRSWTRALLVYLAGIPQRIGYNLKKRGVFLTHKIDPPTGVIHRADYYSGVIEGYGIPLKDRHSQVAVDSGAVRQVEEMLRDEGVLPGHRFVILNTGANWGLKEWPKENFISLCQQLLMRSFSVVISGASKDVARARDIAQVCGSGVVVLAGRTNLKQLMALLSRAAVVVTADSGPMHMASSLGTPVVCIFGPTRPEITGPRGGGRAVILQKDVNCNRDVCYRLNCPDNVCMKAVTVDEVVRAVERLFAEDPR